MTYRALFNFLLAIVVCQPASAQLPPVFSSARATEAGITPTATRLSLSAKNSMADGKRFCPYYQCQEIAPARKRPGGPCKQRHVPAKKTGTLHPALLLDFGTELHGGIQIVTGMYKGNKPVKLRVRFGESASEAMSEIEPKQNATNDHAMRGLLVQVPWLGKLEVGNTGFRFVRIDLLEDSMELQLKEVRAKFIFRDIPYLGTFYSSDSLLNKIWLTGAYTVHLNMQDYLWMVLNAIAWSGIYENQNSGVT